MTRASAPAGDSFAFDVGRKSRVAAPAGGRLAVMRTGLRRTLNHAGPIAVALILVALAGLVVWRLERSREAALGLGRQLIDLRAGDLARRLDLAFDRAPALDTQ